MSMVTLFNQLTHDELADYSKFDNLLDYHYEKFKYLYRVIEGLTLEGIKSITCADKSEKELRIFIFISDKKKAVSIGKKLNEIVRTFKSDYKKYFKVSVTVEEARLVVVISAKKIAKEEDIYEDRFNSD